MSRCCIALVRVAVAVVLASGLAPGRAAAEAETKPVAQAPTLPGEDEALYSCKQRTGQVVVSFKADAEIKDLIAWVMSFTCKNFLYDPRILSTGKKVSLVTPNKLSPTEAYSLFLGALATVGLTVVPRGNVLRVVEAATAKKEALALRQGMPDDVEQVVRYVYKPSYIAAEPLRQAWLSLKSDAGDVFAFGTVVVVTDYASQVRSMMGFAKLVDVPGGSDGIYTIAVHHADAAKLVEKLNGILSITASAPAAKPAAPAPDAPRGDAAAVPTKIMVDERTNTLLLASSEAGYQRVKALVDRLDVSLELESGSAIHIYPLGSAIADELAKTLTTAIDGRAAKATTPTTGTAAPAPGKPAVAAVAPAPAASDAALDGLGAALEGQVRVIADAPTNSLIVMSSGRDFVALKDVIRQLDQPRRQVYIEAMILEIDMGNETKVGASGHGLATSGSDGAVLLGGVENGDVNTTQLASSLVGATGLFAGIVSPTIDLLGMSIPSFSAMIHAVATTSNIHVISTPSIIAVDNVEAKYKVGLTIQVSDGTTTVGLTSGANPTSIGSSHYTATELPLVLNIKPHISNNDLVLLEVTHEAKELSSSPQSAGPAWTTRSFETRVVVRDQQTVVLGGLTQDKEQHEISKVPLLGDIPLLGYLFKSNDTTIHHTNLLVLLTPYIIKDQNDLAAIRERKLREHDELARSFSSLDRMQYEPRMDYRRKRGLIEDINRSVTEIEQDAAARAALTTRPATVETGPVELPATAP